jgi:hypothetical protein
LSALNAKNNLADDQPIYIGSRLQTAHNTKELLSALHSYTDEIKEETLPKSVANLPEKGEFSTPYQLIKDDSDDCQMRTESCCRMQ